MIRLTAITGILYMGILGPLAGAEPVDALSVDPTGTVTVSEGLKVGIDGETVTKISSDPDLSDPIQMSSAILPTQSAVREYVASVVRVGGFTTGDIKYTMAVTEPEGWLFLNGQEVPRTGQTAQLFALFGTTYGAGDGTTTFNLPDASGRVLAAVDDLSGTPAGVVSGSIASTVGGTQGSESHQLTIAEMPEHGHGMDSAGNHSHALKDGGKDFKFGSGPHTDHLHNNPSGTNTKNQRWTTGTNAAGNHSHNIHSAGGNQPHPNLQPTMFVNVLIKL